MKEWTPGRRKAFITSVLRGGFRRYPEKYQCLNAAKVGRRVNSKTGRLAEHYKCNVCNNTFPAKDIQVDHVSAIVSARGFTTWDDFIAGLYCGADNLQAICVTCHSYKTASEREERKKK